jgi:CDP-diacylglycerol--serine O-phosphatidyltransferase
MNMFSGLVSIIYSAEGRFMEAAALIIIASIFDALDGFMARLTKSSSEFGVELDSLSDVVSFGVAPSCLIYYAHLHSYDVLGIIISSSLMVFGGYRLARFNVQLVGFDKSYFTGLPIPSSAITIASYVLIYMKDGKFNEPYSYFIIPLVIALSLLMVSKIKYDTFPKISMHAIKTKPLYYGVVFLAVVAVAVTGGKAIFFVFILFILFGIFRHIYNFFLPKSE